MIQDEPIFKDYISLVKKHMESIKDSLAGGSCPDYPTYKAKSGEYSGLKKALSLLEESIKNYQDD